MLEIKNLVVRYGRITALHGIDLTLGDNEVVALIGNNGAGKTTTLKAISGMQKPASGSIEFNGTSLIGLPSHKIVEQGIIHVPEGRRIFTKMTVKENLLMGSYSVRDAKFINDKLAQVIDLFPILKERINQFGGTLSGGEQQMLAVARAL